MDWRYGGKYGTSFNISDAERTNIMEEFSFTDLEEIVTAIIRQVNIFSMGKGKAEKEVVFSFREDINLTVGRFYVNRAELTFMANRTRDDQGVARTGDIEIGREPWHVLSFNPDTFKIIFVSPGMKHVHAFLKVNEAHELL